MKWLLLIIVSLTCGIFTCFGMKSEKKDEARWFYLIENHPDIAYDYCKTLFDIQQDSTQQMFMQKLIFLCALAQRGHLQAITDLGQMYIMSARENEREKGREFLIRAAQAGHKPACCILSRDCFSARRIPEGLAWLAKALIPAIKMILCKDKLDFKYVVLYDNASITLLNEVKNEMYGQKAKLIIEALEEKELRAE